MNRPDLGTTDQENYIIYTFSGEDGLFCMYHLTWNSVSETDFPIFFVVYFFSLPTPKVPLPQHSNETGLCISWVHKPSYLTD